MCITEKQWTQLKNYDLTQPLLSSLSHIHTLINGIPCMAEPIIISFCILSCYQKVSSILLYNEKYRQQPLWKLRQALWSRKFMEIEGDTHYLICSFPFVNVDKK